jgi:hypothetical protein
MGILVSRGYVNSNFTIKPTGTPDTDTSRIADVQWIDTNYFVTITGGYTANRCPSSDQLINTPPYLNSFTVSSDFRTTLGGYAEIVRTSTDISNCFVTIAQRVLLSTHGIDTDYDGVGDLNFYERSTSWYIRKNGGSWTFLSDVDMPVDNAAGVDTYSPITLNYGDLVDVEIRHSSPPVTTTTTTPPAGAGYYNCGYGCQWYTYDPGCTPCTPVSCYSIQYTTANSNPAYFTIIDCTDTENNFSVSYGGSATYCTKEITYTSDNGDWTVISTCT